MACVETISFKIMSLRCEECGAALRVPKTSTAYKVSSEHAATVHKRVLAAKGNIRCE